jgi:hypothetical protein
MAVSFAAPKISHVVYFITIVLLLPVSFVPIVSSVVKMLMHVLNIDV